MPFNYLRSLQVVMIAMFAICPDAMFGQSFSIDEKTLTQEKVLHLAIRIDAPLDSVWFRISTKAGMEKFFAPNCIFKPEVLSLFEIHFNPAGPVGQKGAEDNRVLAIQDKQMISFTWDAPPQFAALRKHRTSVAIRLYKTGDRQTLVTLSQTGWGLGKEWDSLFTYFEQAWATFVLPNLKYSLEVKPVDWKDFPKNAPQNLKPAEKI
jgi:uncharacterized protein YndB with AHSA1/START domain